MINFNSSKKATIAASILIVGLAILIYAQASNFEYVLDDTLVITKNNYVKKGFDGITKILSSESFEGYFGEQKNLLQGARFRPLSLVTFAVEYGTWGLNSSRAHWINIFLYAFCCLSIFYVLLELFKEKKHVFLLALISTVIYLVHPVHVEAVANVKGRDEILAMIFALWTLFFAIKYNRTEKFKYLLFTPILFFLGLLAKENVITFLAVVPLFLYCFESTSVKKSALILGTLLLTTIAYLIYRISVIGYLIGEVQFTDVMNNPFLGMDFSTKYATIAYTLTEYLRLSFFPHPLTHDYYPYHIPISSWTDLKPIIAIISHLAILSLGVYGALKKKIWGFSLLFYLLTLSIVSNVFIGVGTFMNERFLFMPSLGFCLAIAYLFRKYGIKHQNKVINYTSWIFMMILISGFSYKSFTRVPAWQNGLTLNSEAIKVSKNSARANSFMSTAIFEDARDVTDRNKKLSMLREALPYAQKATDMIPDYKNANIMYCGIYAEIYKLDRNETELLKGFKTTISRRPDVEYLGQFLDYFDSRAQDVQSLRQFYFDCGYNILFRQQRRMDWALHYLKRGFALDQTDPIINKGLAEVYQALNNQNQAQIHLANYERYK